MISITRRCRAWVLGLFVAAQAAGVVALLDTHAQHGVGHRHAATTMSIADATPDRSQHHDDAGCCDQCCTIGHHLTGIACPSPAPAPASHAGARICVPAPARFAGNDSIRLERPPKPLRLT